MALKTFLIPTKTYQPGVQTIPGSAVPPESTRMTLTLDVTNWSVPTVVVDVAMELSQDGGVSWRPGGRAPLQCRSDGTFRSPIGEILTQVTAQFSWPSGVTHARGTVVITGNSVRTGGTVEIF